MKTNPMTISDDATRFGSGRAVLLLTPGRLWSLPYES